MARSPKVGVPFVKSTTSKGHRYYYFDTGTVDSRGKKVFTRLPDPNDKAAFGVAYAALVGHRTRRENEASVLTIASVIDLYRSSRKFASLSAGSKGTYDVYLRELAATLGMAPANDVLRSDMVLMVDKRADKPGAANMLLKVSRAMFKWARSRGHVTVDPCADIDLNELGEHQPWIDSLLQDALVCEDDRVRLAVHLLYFTAQRIGDVVRMQFADIQKDGMLFVRQGKTGKELMIPIHSSLRKELERTGRRLGPMVISDQGKAMSERKLREAIQAWASAKGHKIVPHGLRKNAVNALLEAECSVAQTAAISGQTMQLVEHYAKQRNQRKLAHRAIEKWEGNGA